MRGVNPFRRAADMVVAAPRALELAIEGSSFAWGPLKPREVEGARRACGALLFTGAAPAAGQNAPEAHTRFGMFTVGADDSGPGTFRIDVRPRGSDEAFEMPAMISFVPNTGRAPFRGTEFTIASGLALRRLQGGGSVILPADGVTVGARRSLVSRSSLTTSVGSHLTLMRDGSGASHGTDVSTWLANGTHDLSFAAGFERAAEGSFLRKVSSQYVRTISGRFDGVVDVAYASSGSESWLSVSEGMTYWPQPHLQLDLAIRHERSDTILDASVSLGLTVRFNN